MSTFEVKIEEIKVYPHPNADLLELAQVGLFNIVVGKGSYKTGDKVLYIPEFSVLPENLIVKLGLEGKLAGKNKDRVRPIRLRGELSQGLVAPISYLPEGVKVAEDEDYSEILGITKWEPEVPSSLSGDVEGNFELVSWIDIENLKKFPDLFAEGERIVVTEKIHGTASCYTFLKPGSAESEVIVSSKGLGAKKLVLKPSEKVLYWKVLDKCNVAALAEHVAEVYASKFGTKDSEGNVVTPAVIEKVAVFGETFGSQVQDLHYGVKFDFNVFDIYVSYSEAGESKQQWLSPEDVSQVAASVGVTTAPELFVGDFSLEKIVELASGKEQVSGRELHIREGVVIRPVKRVSGYSDGSKKIAKYVSDAYLTRKNGTEYN